MSNSDLNGSGISLEDVIASTSGSKKPSKTRKVIAASVSVAKRPLRTVGRMVSKRKHSIHAQGYGSIEEGDEALDDEEEDLIDVAQDDDDDNSGPAAADGGIPEVIGPQQRGSFMERVNSYRSGVAGSGSAEMGGSTTTPRRGSLTGALRSAVGGSGGDAATAAGELPLVGDQRDWVVFRLERYLRQITLVLAAFIVGSFKAEWRVFVWKALEYALVAWGTCGVLWFMAMTSTPPTTAGVRPRQLFAGRRLAPRGGAATPDTTAGKKSKIETVTTDPGSAGGEAATVKTGDSTGPYIDDDRPKARGVEPRAGAANDDELAILLPEKAQTQVDEVDTSKKKRSKRTPKKKPSDDGGEAPSTQGAVMPHAALNPFYTIDTTTGERVIPNSSSPHSISNDWFDMTMMVLIRTPDVDDPAHPKGNEENEAVCNYMRDKQRRFEFQYQLKLKKLPENQKIYFAAELEEPVKMGIIQRAFVGAAMAFIKSTNNSFHYSMAGSKEDPDGRWEKPHMSFPVEMSMDRVVVTKAGDAPPTLGDVIYEDPESIKARKKGGPVDWNLEDTYTMALWTAYVDFLEWKVINLPGIRPFELNKVIGPQPILLTLYLIPVDRSAEKHYRRDITQVVELELCNTDTGLLGEFARKWAAKQKNQPITPRSEDTHSTAGELLGDETEYDAADAATAAELGEGMYLRSGDSVVLRESGADNDENENPCFVTNGAGFAVLAEGVSSASTIVMQKARRKSVRSRARSELIKSGDTVSVRLVTKGRNRDETEIRYLSIHRGWWLKWVSTPPKKNGFFTIFTHETEFADHDNDELPSSETQSQYLTFGGSFWLRHKRWSQYSVGSSSEGSATYGGRVLGLFQPLKGASQGGAEMSYNSDDEDLSLTDGKGKRRWMKPLQLRAYEASQASMASVPGLAKIGSEEQPSEEPQSGERPKLVFSNEDSRLDVPAWVEVMNRTERIRQLAYAVRVEPSSNSSSEESVSTLEPLCKPFVRLRTGRDLAEIMRVGLSWRSTAAFPEKNAPPRTPVSPNKTTSASSIDGAVTPTRGGSSPSAAFISSVNSRTGPPNLAMDGSFEDLNGEEGSQQWESDDDDTEGPSVLDDSGPTKKSKRRIVGSTIGAIGKVAKAGATAGAKVAKAGAKGSVKAGVAVTKAGVGVTKGGASMGKKVVVSSVKTSVKIGKGTVSAGVSAGKAIISSTSRSKNPPGRQPKSKAGQQAKWRRERDLHVAVNKTVKQIGPEQSNLFFLAGELAAPEQSYRTVSNVLARMSSIPTSSPFSGNFNNILSTQIVQASDQDTWFLSGGAMQIGVVPDPKQEVLKGALVCESLVARCLWESHWREEWCGVYRKSIVFYAPLTTKACLEFSFSDVQSIRMLDTQQRNPLPGFPILAIETAWQCHYLAFPSDEARDSFREKVEILIPKRSARAEVQITGASERELWKARFWQGFQNSVESESAICRGKWAEVQSGSKSICRTILNGRRMDFDLDEGFLREAGGLGKYVEDLLSTSLSFSLSSLERDPERLVKFLDAVSHLRLIPIIEIDREGVEACCLFVNLYHCLLQHALLLAVNGPLHRRTVGNFMRASCYEIGGDVFSLAEIQSCIIRGNMSRPVSPKPPYVDAPKKSNAYRFYALKFTDPRINFVLNTGDVSCPQDIPVLRPERIEDQLSTASVAFLESQLSVDVIRRCVLLPRVCEVYKNDFEDEASGCLYYCSRYLDSATVNALKRMLREETTLTIKYQSSADQYHTKLVLRKEKEDPPPPELTQSSSQSYPQPQQQQQSQPQQTQRSTPQAPPTTTQEQPAT
ncbi:expressed unknown protein [Seminavis robusta]|uniref:DUF547 domain-containing protein n=1 Tax=Seminavis robusta TaxID=568900 RepID=A0A9N8HB33_9STRA|nr:expressed unknown protein [Seminavis robusta]|eukprot:Sro346_g122600.1 n/a (1797) ;mRNA; r:2587-8548